MVDYPVLDTIVDDSGTHRQTNSFILAGFASDREHWSEFAWYWKQKLHDYNIPFFKPKSIRSKRYLDRALDFTSLITKHIDYAVSYRLLYHDYVAIMEGNVWPEVDNPFFQTLFNLVIGVARSIGSLPEYESHTLGFVFDDSLSVRTSKKIGGT